MLPTAKTGHGVFLRRATLIKLDAALSADPAYDELELQHLAALKAEVAALLQPPDRVQQANLALDRR